MRILITGATHQSWTGEMESTRTTTVARLLSRGLGAEHSVYMERATDIGPVEGFDVIFIGLSNFKAVGAKDTLAMFKIIVDAEASEIPWYWFLDTWELDKIKPAFRSMLTTYWGMFKDKQEEDPGPWEKVIGDIAMDFLEGKSAPILVPMFDPKEDARIAMRLCDNQIYTFDPSSVYSLGIDQPKVEVPRYETWGIASLEDCSYWVNRQEFGWPVRTMGFPDRKTQISEADVFDEYRRCAAVAIPAHSIYTGRLWRAQYWNAARSGAITFSPSVHMQEMLPQLRLTVQEIESMSAIDRARQATVQRIDLMNSTWSFTQLTHFLSGVVK